MTVTAGKDRHVYLGATMPKDLVVQPSGMETLSPQEALVRAFNENPTAEMAKQIVDLQQSMERFQWEREERQAKIDFDDALNRCQKEIDTVRPNRNRENSITWADYIQIDKAIRPIYTKEGFALAFSEGECSTPGKIKIVATLSRGGINRQFEQNITPASRSNMSATDTDAAANSRAQRYLVLKIFNIAVGIAADEEKGNISDENRELITAVEKAETDKDLNKAYLSGQQKAMSAKDMTLVGLLTIAAQERRKALKEASSNA
jgi:hypothetical protein